MRNIILLLILCAASFLPNRACAQVILSIDTVSVACNSTGQVVVPMRVKNFSGVGSFQLTLQWDMTKLQFVQTSGLNPALDISGVDATLDITTFINQGKLVLTWSFVNPNGSGSGLTVPDGTVVFSTTFNYLGGGFGSAIFATGPVPVFVSDPQGGDLPHLAVNGGVSSDDTEDPTITCPANVVDTSSVPLVINGIAPLSVADNCGAPNVGWAATGSTNDGDQNDPDASGTTFNPGLTTLTYTASDAGGNEATCAFTIDIQTIVPPGPDTLTIIAQKLTQNCGPTSAAINITAQHFDNVGALQFSVSWDKQVLDFESVSTFNATMGLALSDFNLIQADTGGRLAMVWASPVQGGVSVPDGETLFRINFTPVSTVGATSAVVFGDSPVSRQAFDALGNDLPSKYTNGSYTRRDNTPPVLTCPANVTVTAPTGQTSATVNSLAATVSDNCGGTPTTAFARTGATTGSGSGSANGTYNIGVTDVRYTATDASGNTSTCTFQVTVEPDLTDALVLSMDTVLVDCQTVAGQEIIVPVRVSNFQNISGLVFNVQWDPAALSLTDVVNLNPALNLQLFPQLFQDTASGVFHFFGAPSSVWPTLADGSVFFALKFVAQTASLTADLDFISVPPSLSIEALDGSGNAIPVQIISGYVSISTDSAPPVFVICPSDTTVDADPTTCDAVVSLADPVVTDDCSGVASVESDFQGATFPIGDTFVTYTATDSTGKSSKCSLTVTVAETASPVFLFCPPGVTVGADTINCDAVVDIDDPIAFDCSGIQSISSDYQSAVFPAGITLVTFTAIDNTGRTAACEVEVTVDENTPPRLTSCPSGTIVINAPPSECSANVNFPDPDAFDCSGIQSLTVVPARNPGGDFTFMGTTTVTFTATDNTGQTSTCSFVVQVRDNQPPIFSPNAPCPNSGSFDAPLGACERIVTWPEPIGFDPCDPNNVTVTSTHPSGFPFQVGNTLVTYTATDAGGLTATCSFIVTIVDKTPPSIACPSDLTIEPDTATCMAIAAWDLPNAADACDNSVAISGNINPGENLPLGVTTVNYLATDDDGNTAACSFVVTVPDSKPVQFFTCPDNEVVPVTDFNLTFGCGTDNYFWDQPQYGGSCDQTNLTIEANFLPGDYLPLGLSEVVYVVKSPFGSTDTCRFTVTVEDRTAPIFITFPANITVNLPADQCTAPVQWLQPVFSDLCQTIADTNATHQPGDVFGIGTETVTYTITDAAGNTASNSFSVTVRDVTAPTLTNCPPDMTVDAAGACEKTLTWPTVTATDFCDSGVEVLPTSLLTGGTFQAGLNEFIFEAIDDAGNRDTCFVRIMVNAVLNPGFDNCPQNFLFFGCESPPVQWTPPTEVGFCDGNVTITSTHNPGDVFPIGVNTVTYTAMDISGHSALCSFTVTVSETQPPTFSCPAGATVDVAGNILSDPSNFLTDAEPVGDCAGTRLFFENPTATDNCTNVSVVLLGTPASGDAFPIGTTSLTFRATDSADNTTLCVVEITVSALPAPLAEADPSAGCPDDNVFLRVLNPIPGAKYEWTGPEPNYPDTTVLMLLLPGNEGTYTVNYEINGCKSIADTLTVTLINKPDAKDDSGFVIKAGEALDSINVIANDIFSLGPDLVVTLAAPVQGVTYVGDGIFSFAGTSEPGTVTFMYQICSKTCPDLCDKATVVLTIQDDGCVFIPNIITPNGDGINDDFYIPCIDSGQFSENSLTIYNQWGDKVYEASPYVNGSTTGWKGTLDGKSGKDLPDGVYYYIFKPSPTAAVIKGFVEIFR